MNLLIQRLHSSGFLSSQSSQLFLNSLVCDIESKSCFCGECEKCKLKDIKCDNNTDRSSYVKENGLLQLLKIKFFYLLKRKLYLPDNFYFFKERLHKKTYFCLEYMSIKF